MPRLVVVLVRPESAANVGACARVVRNTGAGSLRLVRPGDWRTVECWRSAWGAQDVLERTQEFAELAPALAGAALTLALSARRATDAPALDIREAARDVAGLGRDETAALVFGPESSGLSNEELALCGRSAKIPSDRAQPSYNLSHAVAIAAYECFRAARPLRLSGASQPPHGERPRRATHDEKARLVQLLRQGLQALRALPERESKSLAVWQALVQRVDLSRKELKLLEHMARKMARSREP